MTGGILDPKAPPHLTYPFVATKNLHELRKFMRHVEDDLPYVTAPALIVQGRKDSMVPPVNGELIHSALGSKVKHLLYLDRSDHVLPMDYDREILFEKAWNFIRSEGKGID